MAILKKENAHLQDYENLKDAQRYIGHFTEDVYNHKRHHYSLDYFLPGEFEAEDATQKLLTIGAQLAVAAQESTPHAGTSPRL